MTCSTKHRCSNTCFHYNRSWRRPPTDGSVDRILWHRMETVTIWKAWEKTGKSRLNENFEECKGRNVGDRQWWVRRRDIELYSQMWLLWPGSLQRSRWLHRHLKIAPAIIYLVGIFHPVLCSWDHSGQPITVWDSCSHLLAASWVCDILCVFGLYLSQSPTL